MKILLVFLFVGGLGGLAGIALKIPGGALVGAMLAVILFKAFSQVVFSVPRPYLYTVQVLVGVMVGAGYTPELGGLVLKLVRPVLVSTLMLVGAGLVVGLVFCKMAALDPVTGYLATSPGAMSSLIPLAAEAHAQPAVVAAFHFFRLVFILLTAPLILKLVQAFTTRSG